MSGHESAAEEGYGFMVSAPHDGTAKAIMQHVVKAFCRIPWNGKDVKPSPSSRASVVCQTARVLLNKTVEHVFFTTFLKSALEKMIKNAPTISSTMGKPVSTWKRLCTSKMLPLHQLVSTVKQRQMMQSAARSRSGPSKPGPWQSIPKHWCICGSIDLPLVSSTNWGSAWLNKDSKTTRLQESSSRASASFSLNGINRTDGSHKSY